MNLSSKDVLPVLLGGDLNAYSMAASFARLGIRSVAFARRALPIVKDFKYVDLHIIEALDDCNTAVPELIRFAEQRQEKRLLIILLKKPLSLI